MPRKLDWIIEIIKPSANEVRVSGCNVRPNSGREGKSQVDIFGQREGKNRSSARKPQIPCGRVAGVRVLQRDISDADRVDRLVDGVGRAPGISGTVRAIRATQVSGRIDQIRFKDGDEIHKDQPLFTIDPRPYQASLEAALAESSARLEAWLDLFWLMEACLPTNPAKAKFAKPSSRPTL